MNFIKFIYISNVFLDWLFSDRMLEQMVFQMRTTTRNLLLSLLTGHFKSPVLFILEGVS